MADEAVSVVEDALRNGDAKVATTMLRTMGVMRTPRRGPTDPHIVELKMELGRWREQYQIVMEMLKHLLNKMGVPPEMHNDFIKAEALARKARRSMAAAKPASPAGPMAQSENPVIEPPTRGNDGVRKLNRQAAAGDEQLADGSGERGESNVQCAETSDELGETLEEMVLKAQRTAVEEFMADPKNRSICDKALASLGPFAPQDFAAGTTAVRQDDAQRDSFE